MNIDLNNLQQTKLLHSISETSNNIFLTGRAGTGKSTILRYLLKNIKKNIVALAPTGIAALNIGGSTIHSFFQLPLSFIQPSDKRLDLIKYKTEKRKIIQKINLIIIDEISMCRVDILDAIDYCLRRVCKSDLPFAGKQLLLVGDLYQLEPVIMGNDKMILNNFYNSLYFFSAYAFQNTKIEKIILNKVYRQKDPYFIDLLDRIRIKQVNQKDLDTLNTCYQKKIKTDKQHTSILLTALKQTAEITNTKELLHLKGSIYHFYGKKEGNFPDSILPVTSILGLKKNAQIMFVKNDKYKRWVNGTIGIVTNIKENEISVLCQNSNQEVKVSPEIWKNEQYILNLEGKIESDIIGSYKQYPLQLAWAITIHKSQGLSFDQVTIDLGKGSFTAGQTYVAISRCRSFQGLSLSTKIKQEDLIVREEILEYMEEYYLQYTDPSL